MTLLLLPRLLIYLRDSSAPWVLLSLATLLCLCIDLFALVSLQEFVAKKRSRRKK